MQANATIGSKLIAYMERGLQRVVLNEISCRKQLPEEHRVDTRCLLSLDSCLMGPVADAHSRLQTRRLIPILKLQQAARNQIENCLKPSTRFSIKLSTLFSVNIQSVILARFTCRHNKRVGLQMASNGLEVTIQYTIGWLAPGHCIAQYCILYQFRSETSIM